MSTKEGKRLYPKRVQSCTIRNWESMQETDFQACWIGVGSRHKVELWNKVGLGHVYWFESTFLGCRIRPSGKDTKSRCKCAVRTPPRNMEKKWSTLSETEMVELPSQMVEGEMKRPRELGVLQGVYWVRWLCFRGFTTYQSNEHASEWAPSLLRSSSSWELMVEDAFQTGLTDRG